MRVSLLFPALLLAAVVGAEAQNLIPNSNFSDPEPLKHWRVDFPYQEWYVKNASYISETKIDGKKCAMIDLPPGIAGNEGGKVETALVPCEPGATYRVEAEAYLPVFLGKIHADIYAVDPRDNALREAENAKGANVTVLRIPPFDGKPALVMIYRAQVPDPTPGAKWSKVQRDFTVPFEWPIADGKYKVKPAYIAIKGYTFQTTMAAGKSYFTNFKLFKIKSGSPTAANLPTPGGVGGIGGNASGQKGKDREIALTPEMKKKLDQAK